MIPTYIPVDVHVLFLITAFEHGILGESDWTKIWKTNAEIQTVEYLDDLDVRK